MLKEAMMRAEDLCKHLAAERTHLAVEERTAMKWILLSMYASSGMLHPPWRG